MKKIVFAITNLEGGGAEKVLVDILNNLDKNSFDITILLLKRKGVYINAINNNIKIQHLFPNNKYLAALHYRFLKYFPKLYYKIFINEEFDVEVAFLEGIVTKLIASSNNKKSKKIAWVHIDLIKEHWTKKDYFGIKDENEYYNKFNDIIFVSNDCQSSFNSMFKLENIKQKVIYNPIIIDNIVNKSNEFEVNYNKFTIVSVGRLHKQKAFDRLIKAHATVKKIFPHNLLIIGEGPERKKLELLIKSMEVEDSVELKGFIKNPYPFIKAANLYISSSISEGHPLVILEAIALEKAIIATNITGAREILQYGEYGYLCENSQEGLENALSDVLFNLEKINDLEKQSKIRKQYFDYKATIKEIENVLNEN